MTRWIGNAICFIATWYKSLIEITNGYIIQELISKCYSLIMISKNRLKRNTSVIALAQWIICETIRRKNPRNYFPKLIGFRCKNKLNFMIAIRLAAKLLRIVNSVSRTCVPLSNVLNCTFDIRVERDSCFERPLPKLGRDLSSRLADSLGSICENSTPGIQGRRHGHVVGNVTVVSVRRPRNV